jgi:hypothetical protein
MKSIEVEVARHGEIRGQLVVFEVAHARRRHGSGRQPVIEPGGGAVAQVGADRRMDRAQHLQGHEHDRRERQRHGQVAPALDGAHQHARRDGEHGRQDAAGDQHGPPGNRHPPVGPRQDGEELPLLARPQPTHDLTSG